MKIWQRCKIYVQRREYPKFKEDRNIFAIQLSYHAKITLTFHTLSLMKRDFIRYRNFSCNACKGLGFWLAAGLIYSKKSAQSVNFEKIMSLSCAKERTQGK